MDLRLPPPLSTQTQVVEDTTQSLALPEEVVALSEEDEDELFWHNFEAKGIGIKPKQVYTVKGRITKVIDGSKFLAKLTPEEIKALNYDEADELV